MPTRRTILITAALGVPAALIINTANNSDLTAFIRNEVIRLFKRPAMTEDDLSRFAQDYLAAMRRRDILALHLIQQPGVDAVKRLRRSRDKHERNLVTKFITSTNFLSVRSNGSVTYFGINNPCANPFR